MRQKLMADTAEFLRSRGHVVSWLIDKAILSPGVPNPNAEIVLTVNGHEFRENTLLNYGNVNAVASRIENLLLP